MTEVDQMCEDVKEQNENSASSVRLSNNLIEIYYKILENVKYKLTPFIEHLLKDPYDKKIYWWFCLFLDPIYTADPK